MPRVSSSRWTFTLNNYSEQEYASLEDVACKYMVVGKEVGDSGTPHLQGYVVFGGVKRLSAVRRIFSRAHWEMANGDTDSNYGYCSKDGDFREWGTRPMNRQEQAGSQHEKWKDVIRAARSGTAEDEYPAEFIRYHSTLTRLFSLILRLYKSPVQTLPEYSGVWAYGKPGTGKSRWARDAYTGLYDKLINKWWDGYSNEETVLIDDLSLDHGFLGSFLKRWCDHYPFRAEVKGGSMVIRPKTIIVTSNYTIDEIFDKDPELVLALKRRFTNKHFVSLYMTGHSISVSSFLFGGWWGGY